VVLQQTHHDVWDYDSGNQPILFDMQVRGRRVKALAEASKNGFLYILNRETGEPVHPINEVPVPTKSERPGEQPWPTQPIPFTASGKMMAPVSPVTATDIPAERLATYAAVPMFTPLGRNQIQTPGQGGGANYGPLAQPTNRVLRERHRRSEQLRRRRRLLSRRPHQRRAGESL
jgi:quinoprotein glucose dehydrogenase